MCQKLPRNRNRDSLGIGIGPPLILLRDRHQLPQSSPSSPLRCRNRNLPLRLLDHLLGLQPAGGARVPLPAPLDFSSTHRHCPADPAGGVELDLVLHALTGKMIEKSGRAGERDKGIGVQSRVIDAIKDVIELQGGRGLHFVHKEIIQYCSRILHFMSTK